MAHGEGRCFWANDAVKEEAMRQNCVALKYVDDDGYVNAVKLFFCNPAHANSRPAITIP